jgi:HicA toxin of bacterial toxin-antitoxin,
MPPFNVTLNGRNCEVLCRIFIEPTRADIDWDDLVRLVVALGGDWPKMGQTSGSRRRAKLNGVKGLFHKPHPGSVMKKGSVESARDFLQRAGVTPITEGCKCSPTS